MKLQFIRINNFKQFFGDHVAHFSMLEDKNVTIFHGKNGAGKTSLFSSITWCLYGEGEDTMGDLLNRQVLSEMTEGEEQPVVVTLSFRHDNEEYIAERVKYFTKVDGKPKSGKTHFSLSKIDASGQNKPQPNPEGKMDDILPNKVREYFFFDGEKMDELTKSGNKKIEEAIRNIMRLHILDNTEKHLREVYKDYRSEVQKQGNLNTAELISEQEELEAGIERYKQQIKERQSEIHVAEKHIQDIEHTLEDSKGVGELQAERKNLQSGLENLDAEKSQTASSIWEKVNLLYPIFLHDLLSKAQGKINSQVGKGKIPSGIQEQFLKELLKSQVCVCGRKFEAGSDCEKTLLDLLTQTRPNTFEDHILSLRGEVTSIDRLTTERKAVLLEKSKQYYKIKDDIEEQIRLIDALSRKIGDSKDIDVVSLEAKRTDKVNRVKLFHQDIGRFESFIEVNNDKLVKLGQRREIEEQKQEQLQRLRMRENTARSAADAMEVIKNKFYEETRIRVEAETKKVFDQLAWKTDQFNEVRLDEDFSLEVIDRWNQPTRQELSAGERQILSLAFISAMTILSGEESPIIMDTPFARLSGEHLKNVAARIPDIATQLILFVTDNEWNEASKTPIDLRIGKEYTLKFNDDFGCTTIEEM